MDQSKLGVLPSLQFNPSSVTPSHILPLGTKLFHQKCWHLIRRWCAMRFVCTSWLCAGRAEKTLDKILPSQGMPTSCYQSLPAFCTPISSKVVSCGRHAFWSIVWRLSVPFTKHNPLESAFKHQPWGWIFHHCAMSWILTSWFPVTLMQHIFPNAICTIICNQVKSSKVAALAIQAVSTPRVATI